MQEISFTSAGFRLDGTIFYSPDKKDKHPAILFVHGWTSERKRSFQYAKALADAGHICLLFDLRGHGTSEGNRNNSTNEDFLSDVIAAYDYLVKIKGVDSGNISAIGSSFGGYLVAILSSKRITKNLVLRAPADYPNETLQKLKKLVGGDDANIMKWRNQANQPTETYALEALHNFTGSVLLIESEHDDRIPHQTILNYMNAVKDKSKLTRIFLKDAPHSIKEGRFKDKVEQALVDWFRNRL